jgi:amino acid adenylation domain-containing protein
VANTIVGLYIERSPQLIIALLAILKAGGAYMPIDTNLPDLMIATRLKLANPLLIVTSMALEQKTIEYGYNTLMVGDDELNDAPLVNTVADDSAYVLFTSGSTGEPKGIEMGHGPLVNLFGAILHDCPALRDANDVLQLSSIGFDMSFVDTLLALGTGGKLNLIDNDSRMDLDYLAAIIKRQQLTVLNLPYAMLQALCDYANQRQVVFDSIKVILCTAEQLKISDDIRQYFSRHQREHGHSPILINHYGPAETHVVTSHILTGEPQHWPELPPIGKAIANIDTLVLDQQMKPVPTGIYGELYLGGQCLAKGYLNQPQLTGEKFVQSPFDANKRLYKTGDWVRWLTHGELEYLGRMDSQVKIRGFRIELSEIESTLLAFEAVKEVIVLLIEQRLVAYVTGNLAQLAPLALKNWCQSQLPDYMVPVEFVTLPRFALNTNGKVDRQALPKPEGRADNAYEAPCSEIEKQLALLWADILNCDSQTIGKNDNFFTLGGHSLLVTKLLWAISNQWTVTLLLKNIFEQQTLDQQAALIDEHLMLKRGLSSTPSTHTADDEWEF